MSIQTTACNSLILARFEGQKLTLSATTIVSETTGKTEQEAVLRLKSFIYQQAAKDVAQVDLQFFRMQIPLEGDRP